MHSTERRSFLKNSFVLASGALLGVSAHGQEKRSSGKAESGQAKPSGKKQIIRTLGRTGLRMPVVSMGVMNSGNPALVRAALEAGMTHFDTAHGYQKGRNEEMLGNVFKDYPQTVPQMFQNCFQTCAKLSQNYFPSVAFKGSVCLCASLAATNTKRLICYTSDTSFLRATCAPVPVTSLTCPSQNPYIFPIYSLSSLWYTFSNPFNCI